MDLTDELNLKINMSRAQQDTESLKSHYNMLMSAYINLTADYSALHGLIIDVADRANLDVNRILDVTNQKKKEAKEDLIKKMKEVFPDFEPNQTFL